MAVFNFLNVSPTYCESVSKDVRIRRDVLLATVNLTDDYMWPNKKVELPAVVEASARIGVAVTTRGVEYDHSTLRQTYRYLTGDESFRKVVHERIARKDPYSLAISHFLKDGITSWEVVQQLALEQVEIAEQPEDSIISSADVEASTVEMPPAEKEEPICHEEIEVPIPEASAVAVGSIESEEEKEMAEIPSEVLLRMARDEFEHLKRAGALAVQLLERFTQENAELRERIELLEETIATSPTLKEVPELMQLLGITDKLAEQEEKELEKIYGELPCTSPHHGNKKVVYQDRFLDEFHGMDKADAKRVVKQLRVLFNRGPDCGSLQSKRIWHHDLPGTPKGAWCSRAGGGGPHGLRFTWQATDTEVTVFGLYHRNDLF